MSLPGYRRAMNTTESRIRLREDFYLAAAENKTALAGALSTAESCLSIGAGWGTPDIFAIQMFMPSLKEYHGIDANFENNQTLRDNFAKLQKQRPELDVETYTDDIETWEGIKKKVDVVLCFSFLYLVKDTRATLRKMRSWLKPGGILWITHTDGDYLAHQIKEIVPINRGDLLEVDVATVLRNLDLRIIRKYQFHLAYDVRDVSVDFLRYIIVREPSQEDFKRFQNFVEENYADKDKISIFGMDAYLCQN